MHGRVETPYNDFFFRNFHCNCSLFYAKGGCWRTYLKGEDNAVCLRWVEVRVFEMKFCWMGGVGIGR